MESDTTGVKVNETISVVIPKEHGDWLRARAAEDGLTFSLMVRLAIRRMIESENA